MGGGSLTLRKDGTLLNLVLVTYLLIASLSRVFGLTGTVSLAQEGGTPPEMGAFKRAPSPPLSEY